MLKLLLKRLAPPSDWEREYYDLLDRHEAALDDLAERESEHQVMVRALENEVLALHSTIRELQAALKAKAG